MCQALARAIVTGRSTESTPDEEAAVFPNATHARAGRSAPAIRHGLAA